MDLRIEQLKQKYWVGETTLSEEKELKGFFRANPSAGKEGVYFSALMKQQAVKPAQGFIHPARKSKQAWWSLAAFILVLLTIGALIFQNNNKRHQFTVEDPKEAFELTRTSLLMVSEKLNKGKTYSGELDRINDAKKIINH
ncbi:MAG: hypothetical protein L3J66_09600 [Bacteroidales bacterium]|nr:hypothetical protein [Bacteroidales bacterium]